MTQISDEELEKMAQSACSGDTERTVYLFRKFAQLVAEDACRLLEERWFELPDPVGSYDAGIESGLEQAKDIIRQRYGIKGE